ncbi:primosomal protein N' [Nocardia blacklockiae]|uniref:primosomal protein N' n=1 Tax=Nocardia blacklockiae TaxID=480036 RepID=UPI001894215A|nr:primosomal protein N' [Nocardia blacklockiae]MBF6170365.1 primosomal protein N' [Nocardia blacklockiae]
MLEPAHLDRDFDYLVPADMDALAQPGVRVRVRFSGRLIDGFLLARLDETDHTGKLMKLERVVSGEQVLTPEILRLVTAVAARYTGTRADVLRLAIPPRHAKVESEKPRTQELPPPSSPAMGDRPSDATEVAESETEAVGATTGTSAADVEKGPPSADAAASADETPAVREDAAMDESVGEPAALSRAAVGEVGATSRAAVVRPDAPGGAVAGEQTSPRGEASAAGEPAAVSHAAVGEAGQDTNPQITGGKAAAAVDVSRYSAWDRYRHGMSFLEALARGKGPRAGWQALPGEDWARRLAELAAVVVGSGRSAVVVVPDQRDLDRVAAACAELVGEAAVGLAAGLGPAARYRRWLSVLRGTARVVIGTRSAVFAPAQDLGLIAIWDDGDDTYAEPRAPYPHAREVAMLRAHETGAAFVAGGFARTAEIQAVVASGWAHDLVADRAVVRQRAPRISAPGDSDFALERDPVARAVRIPAVAFTAARKALAVGQSVLVQVPRRGYVPALSCAKCRTPARCRHCNGPLALADGDSGGAGAQRPASARELGVAVSRSASGPVAHSPSCRWCGKTEPVFRCSTCGSRALRAVVIGAARTAEELGRAFPEVPIRGSGGASVLTSVPDEPQVVVATIGAEPVVPGGYGVALLLDGWALLGRADLRAAEDALRRWMSAAALVRASGQVVVMAEPSVPTVQALVRWDPVGHARFELESRTEVRFPPAVRFAAIDGTTDSIAELLGEAHLPDGVEILGPVPLPPGARKPFSSGDSPAEVERMILRADRSQAAALSRALTAAQAVRSTHRSDAPLRVQIDPIDIG